MGEYHPNTTWETPVNAMMGSPDQMTRLPHNNKKSTGLLYPAQPGRRDGRPRPSHQWPACHRTLAPINPPYGLSNPFKNIQVFFFRAPHRMKQKPVESRPITLRDGSLPHRGRHPVHQFVQRAPLLFGPAHFLETFECKQSPLESRRPPHPFPHSHMITPIHPFRKGDGAPRGSVRDTNIIPFASCLSGSQI